MFQRYEPSSTIIISSKYVWKPMLIACEHNQFCAHTSVSTVVGANTGQKGSITFPLILNADLEVPINIGIAKISRAILVRTLYLP